MVSDSNDEFITPPSSPHYSAAVYHSTPSTLYSMQPTDQSTSNSPFIQHLCEAMDLDLPDSNNDNGEPSTSASVPPLPLFPELMDLDTDDLNGADVNQLVDRLQELERKKDEVDELYYKSQQQFFDAIENLEIGTKERPHLLDGLKEWKTRTTRNEGNKRKPTADNKLQLQHLVNDIRHPKMISKRRVIPMLLKAQQKDENRKNNAPNSSQLADKIQHELNRKRMNVVDQGTIDKLRQQLANQREPDLHYTLETTADETERERITSIFKHGELYRHLQNTMRRAD